jgi:hypothetical protein
MLQELAFEKELLSMLKHCFGSNNEGKLIGGVRINNAAFAFLSLHSLARIT